MNFFNQRRAAVFPGSSVRDEMAAREAREVRVSRMAADLVEADAFATLADAIRLLMWKGYGSVEVGLLADDARQVAMQSVVAKEMSKP